MELNVSTEERDYFMNKAISNYLIGKNPEILSSFKFNLVDISSKFSLGAFSFEFLQPEKNKPVQSSSYRFNFISDESFEELTYYDGFKSFLSGRISPSENLFHSLNLDYFNDLSGESPSLNFSKIKNLEKIFQPAINELVYYGSKGFDNSHIEKSFDFRRIDRVYSLVNKEFLDALCVYTGNSKK